MEFQLIATMTIVMGLQWDLNLAIIQMVQGWGDDAGRGRGGRPYGTSNE